MLHKGLILAICSAMLFGSVCARAATPANGTPNSATPTNGTPTNGTPTNGAPTNGTPTNGTPTNGTPTNGAPTNGTPTNGTPTNGAPTLANSVMNNGISPAVFENSLLFGNKAVYNAWTQHPVTAASLTDKPPPLYQLWSDQLSILLMSYVWSDAHRVGDDLVYCPAELTALPCANPANQTFFFFGAVGVCDYSASNLMATTPTPAAGLRGWAIDEPLINPAGTADIACQHWMSALLLSETNNAGVHNLLSAMGPSSTTPSGAIAGAIGTQLTAAASAVNADQYNFGTNTPVQSIANACAAGTTGPVNCGWTTASIGTCTPFDTFVVTTHNTSTIPMMVMVNQGIHANDYPFNGGGKGSSDGNFLGASIAGGQASPTFSVQCPPSGTFNVQWAPYSRADITAFGS